MKTIRFLLLFQVITASLLAQTPAAKDTIHLTMTLDEAIQLARTQSLYSFRAKHMYLSRYWEFRSYRASKLPGLKLNSTPFRYDKTVQSVIDSETGENRFVESEAISSNVGLALEQNVTVTGGVLSLNSDARMVQNAGGDPKYTATPFTIGFMQPLNGYNEFRWESKLEPLKFEKAKKEFLVTQEDIGIRTSNAFFNVVMSEINLKIAQTNYSNADTLFRIGKGRFEIGTVTQDELLDLELSLLNANMAITNANINLRQSRSSLNSFLGLDQNVIITCLVPDQIPELKVNVSEAMKHVQENNPEILEFEQDLLEANRRIAETRANSGLNAGISANFGVNKQAIELNELYAPPYGDEKGVAVSLRMPILDWGERRGKIQMARSNRDVTEATVRQARIDLEQDIIIQIMKFNVQDEQVMISAKADTVAQLGYNVTKQRFMIDKVDVIKLNSARNSLDQARRNYVNTLAQYWENYYSIRKLTLYDFEKQRSLIEELDYLLEN
jgi:outer membrane protein TolC